jgi:hypothetical protein
MKHSRIIGLNWGELGYPSFNLAELEVDITHDEVKKEIADIPKENALGPDGFIGAFYSKYWDMVKSDVTQAIH